MAAAPQSILETVPEIRSSQPSRLGYGPVDAVKVGAILATGIKTDEYAALPEIAVLDRWRAANVFANNIRAWAGGNGRRQLALSNFWLARG
jgi:hypothetical protein